MIDHKSIRTVYLRPWERKVVGNVQDNSKKDKSYFFSPIFGIKEVQLLDY